MPSVAGIIVSIALKMYNADESPSVPYIIKYRNTILEAAHPNEVADAIVVQFDSQDLTIPPDLLGYKLDFWTSSIKSSRAVYTKHDLASRYVDDAESIVYMSFLTSSLRMPPIWRALRVLVVEDGERGTNDCYGIVSTKFMSPLLNSNKKHINKRKSQGFVA